MSDYIIMRESELKHYNKNHDAKGRFAKGSGSSSPAQRLDAVNKKMKKLEAKSQKLKRKETEYKVKASKYERKANKVKRAAANPVIGMTDFNRASNYVSLRYEGKGAKYTNKAAVANKKINKIDKKYFKLGQERLDLIYESRGRNRAEAMAAFDKQFPGGEFYADPGSFKNGKRK